VATEVRRDIEGLRAVAVGVVVLYHAHFLGLRGGFIGVDVFFVVSGFLITSLLLREHTASGRISLSRFYGRRVRRLLPASCLVIVGTVVAGNFWLEPLRLRDLGTDAIASGGFVANIVFAQRGTDYLQSALPPSALQHYWSLAVEEQFYVVWPALLALLLWRGIGARSRATIGIARHIRCVARGLHLANVDVPTVGVLWPARTCMGTRCGSIARPRMATPHGNVTDHPWCLGMGRFGCCHRDVFSR